MVAVPLLSKDANRRDSGFCHLLADDSFAAFMFNSIVFIGTCLNTYSIFPNNGPKNKRFNLRNFAPSVLHVPFWTNKNSLERECFSLPRKLPSNDS